MVFLMSSEKDFLMGDLTKQSFGEIIESDRYGEVVERVEDMGTSRCYAGCRTNAINSFLWRIRTGEVDLDTIQVPEQIPKHVNFV